MRYPSPLGEIIAVSSGDALLWLGFEGQRHYPQQLIESAECGEELPILSEVKGWLESYFRGDRPLFTALLDAQGSDFDREVWGILQSISYGERTTYGAIARQIAQRRGVERFSAQAVGGAVGRNPISIIIPCHRVVGADNSMTGFASGVERKCKLLEMESRVVEIVGTQMRQGGQQIEGLERVSINRGECIAIVGNNGSGKSTLAGVIAGRIPMVGTGVRYNFGEDAHPMLYQNIKEITFRDSYGIDDKEYYYQQRWNSTHVDGRKRVCDELDLSQPNPLFEMLNIAKIADKELILLSSGEMRKFQIARSLVTVPKLLIMDNPFIGLDSESRGVLNDILLSLTAHSGVQIVLILSRAEEIPPFVSHVIEMEGMVCKGKCSRVEFMSRVQQSEPESTNDKPQPSESSDDIVVRLNDVTIQYGAKKILNGINLTIHKGEKWAVVGRNGSGKSTLLSLICADNPQSYACDITLFGKGRGSGESIWDIKRRIGYVSPEMHRSYRVSASAVDIVASGLFDTVGLHRKVNDEQRTISMEWMARFGIAELADRDFMRLSSGEQRMVLLARAFVKSPELLILDEPLHGLDDRNRDHVRSIIQSYTASSESTAIIVTHYPEEFPTTITNTFSL